MPDTPASRSATIHMEQDKICKHSVRYKAVGPGAEEAPIANLYLMKVFGAGRTASMPQKITITVTEGHGTPA